MEEALLKYWHIILGAFAGVVWLVRLEAMNADTAKEVRRLWRQREEDMAAAKESRTDVHNMLDELRKDVKTILGRLPK